MIASLVHVWYLTRIYSSTALLTSFRLSSYPSSVSENMILVGALACLVVAELVLSIGTPYLTVQRCTSLTLLHSFHGQGVRPPLLSLRVKLIGIYSVPIQSFSELDSIKVGFLRARCI